MSVHMLAVHARDSPLACQEQTYQKAPLRANNQCVVSKLDQLIHLLIDRLQDDMQGPGPVQRALQLAQRMTPRWLLRHPSCLRLRHA